MRETCGLGRWEAELRRLQYGSPAELARMMGISGASLTEISKSDWLRSQTLADQELSAELLRRQDGAARALQEANLWYEKQYRLPKFEETDRLLAEFSRSPVTQWLDKQGGIESNLAAALGAIHTPFLDVEGALSSVSAVAELQSIGQAIRSTTAFELGFVDSLRTGLGDWRDPIVWPEMLENEPARLDFYIERGVNLDLTNLPPAAFQEVLGQSGLLAPVAEVDRQYDQADPPPQYDDSVDPQRNGQAYDQLLRFELHLRAFLDRIMTATFGADWPRERAPKDVYENWVSRRERAVKSGENPRALIAYADFSDYEKIILRKDNWRDIFAKFFVRVENIRESLQRLYPVRHCTMHARPVTQEDELLLHVEIHRVIKATHRK